MENKDNQVRYFIPVADEYWNTGIGHYVVAATVTPDENPEYSDKWIFDTLNVVGPAEIKEKWPRFCRQYFLEVYEVKEGKLSAGKFIRLYKRHSEKFKNKLVDEYKCYSDYGISSEIEFNTNRLVEKRKEYDEVEIRYNPLCADGWRKQIKEDIENIENTLWELQEVAQRRAKAKEVTNNDNSDRG